LYHHCIIDDGRLQLCHISRLSKQHTCDICRNIALPFAAPPPKLRHSLRNVWTLKHNIFPCDANIQNVCLTVLGFKKKNTEHCYQCANVAPPLAAP
jgi:hypothetical protein